MHSSVNLIEADRTEAEWLMCATVVPDQAAQPSDQLSQQLLGWSDSHYQEKCCKEIKV